MVDGPQPAGSVAAPPGLDVEEAVSQLRAAQQRLNKHITSELDRGHLNDLSVRAPSRLPGWSRGHVLTHLARNADSMTRALSAAQRGDVAERYPGPAGTRDDEIEQGASRPAAELVADVIASSKALEQAFAATTELAWGGHWKAGPVEGRIDDLPWMRWREIELHHADLDLTGFGPGQWSEEFVGYEHERLGLSTDDTAHVANPSQVADRTLVAERNGRGLRDPAGWTADTLDPGWRRPFGRSEIAALESAVHEYRERTGGLDLTLGTMNDLKPEGLEGLVADLRERLIDGPGVVAYEGFPVERFSDQELRVIWWVLSNAVGSPVAQSHRGDVIGDVRDIGTGISGKAGRGYTSNSELNFHADVCDVSGLFFLRTARSGGVTRIASSVTTHDRIAQARPDLLAELYQPMPCSWQNNQPTGERGWYDMPVFGLADGRSSCAYVRTNIIDAEKNAGAPPLTAAQVEAVEFVKTTASQPDMWVERTFGPGAMLFVHNHTVLHLRTAFVDWEEPERKRHLLRIWLSMPNNRQLPETFGTFFGSTAEGSHRGGYQSRTGELNFATG